MKYLMILVVLVIGCKDNFEDPGIVNPYLINSAIGLSSVGNEHNLILDYLSFDSTYSIIDTSSSLRLFDSTLKYLFRVLTT